MATNSGGPMTPHADLVARLRDEDDVLYLVEGAEGIEFNVDAMADVMLEAADEIERLRAALPPPADPPALVALVREWVRAHRGAGIENTHAADAELVRAEVDLLAYPLPAAPPVTDTPQGVDDSRCAVCGWPLDPEGKMCLRGSCSQRPLPKFAVDPVRAVAEYKAAGHRVEFSETLARWYEQGNAAPRRSPTGGHPAMTPTREQLASIEWRGDNPDYASCPACDGMHPEHAPACWLAACLAAPPPEPRVMPPIEPGDWFMIAVNAPVNVKNAGHARALKAPNRRNAIREIRKANGTVWTREPRR